MQRPIPKADEKVGRSIPTREICESRFPRRSRELSLSERSYVGSWKLPVAAALRRTHGGPNFGRRRRHCTDLVAPSDLCPDLPSDEPIIFPAISDRLRGESQCDATPTHELKRTNGFKSPSAGVRDRWPTGPGTRVSPAIGQQRNCLAVSSTRGCVRRVQYHRCAGSPPPPPAGARLTLRSICPRRSLISE